MAHMPKLPSELSRVRTAVWYVAQFERLHVAFSRKAYRRLINVVAEYAYRVGAGETVDPPHPKEVFNWRAEVKAVLAILAALMGTATGSAVATDVVGSGTTTAVSGGLAIVAAIVAAVASYVKGQR